MSLIEVFNRILELKESDTQDDMVFYELKDINDALQEAIWQVEREDGESERI